VDVRLAIALMELSECLLHPWTFEGRLSSQVVETPPASAAPHAYWFRVPLTRIVPLSVSERQSG
jgi:hypothetical protein